MSENMNLLANHTNSIGTSHMEQAREQMRDETKRLEEIIEVIRKHRIVKNGLTPENLRKLIEDLGPTFVKIGQIMSSRNDILPKQYCEELEKLRSEAKPLAAEEIKQVIESEIGRSVEEIFASFEEKPLGSASIAQVHAATMKDGRHVVIKVQRPYVADMMMQDFALLSKAATMLKITPVNETIDFHMVIRELKQVSLEELDFTVEAGHTKEFRENCQEVAYVDAPQIVDDLTTKRVMTMTFVDGFSIGDTAKLEELGYDRNEVGTKLITHYLKQIIDDGFFHGDPHQGNIVISGGKIVWLDLGMTGRLSNKDRNTLRMAITAVAQKDVNLMKNAILNLGECKGTIDHAKLFSDIDSLLDKYTGMDVSDIDMGTALDEVMTLATEHKIALPRGMSMLARGIVTIEGVVSKIAPELNLIDLVSGKILNDMIDDFDLKKNLAYSVQAVYESGKKSLTIPALSADLMKSLIKGHVKFNVELTGYEPLATRLEKLVDKIVIAIFAASLLLGSSLLCMTNMQPKTLGIPTLGCIGYIGAVVLGIYLLISTGRKK